MNNIITFNEIKAKQLLSDLKLLIQGGISFNDAKQVSRHLGVQLDEQSTTFLFWNPEFKEAKKLNLELFLPSQHLKFDKPEQHASFTYRTFPLITNGNFAAASLDDVPIGTKEKIGALYQVKLTYENGNTLIVRDPLASSIPYGIFAPSEIYDVDKALSKRKDLEYYQHLSEQLTPKNDFRIDPSVNLLEIHTQTATREGTLHSLAQRYNQIASKLLTNEELSADEKNLTGFDAIELMPIDPVIEHPENHQFWKPINSPKKDGDELTVRLRKPNTVNWGYDTVIFGAGAINPSLLSSGRPDELIELIEILHNFPKPIKVVLDVCYGHAHNQAVDILPTIYFSGKNIYGQDVNYQHPMVRAIILEMQRRKMNYGFDGIRVDAAQDINYYDSESEKLIYDDDYLQEMSNIKQEVAGVEYRPWMIFEDGRPWPRDDWELAATNREITKKQPYAFQWAPMTFAYNTPYSFTYWVSKWWRIKEVLQYGDKWIGGYANHDTMRRGTQADPTKINVNTQLGNSLKMIMENAYNNPASTLLMNGFLPGVPMDFLQALGSTPWSFMRDTDTTYAIKVVAEEAPFLKWQVTEVEFRQSHFFTRLKYMGFKSLSELRRFSQILLDLVGSTNYDPSIIARNLNKVEPGFDVNEWTEQKLKKYAAAWMLDVNEYCNVDQHSHFINKKKADFNLEVRNFRLNNPWLINKFQDADMLSYHEPLDGSVIFFGYRKDPGSGKELVFIANMEGQPKQITPSKLPIPILNTDRWKVGCGTPSISHKKITDSIRFSISQALIFEKT
ncbi:MAG: glucosylglycerol hydrolase [Balneolaceae bacterium]